MHNFLSLLHRQNKRLSAAFLFSLWVLFATSANAIDFECKLPENTQIKPAVIATMMDAADKGYLYYVDASTSNITFKVQHFPFSTVEGNFDQFQGGMAMPAGTEHSKQALFIIKTNSIATGDNDLDDYLKSSVFFNVIKFPEIIFVSTGFEWINKSTARLYGNLTLHGTTKPLVFNMHIDTSENYDINKNQTITMIASAEIQRSDFGMHEMQIFVSDTVSFNLKIKASLVGS